MCRTLGIPKGSFQAIKDIMKMVVTLPPIPFSQVLFLIFQFFPFQNRLLLFFQKDFCAMFSIFIFVFSVQNISFILLVNMEYDSFSM